MNTTQNSIVKARWIIKKWNKVFMCKIADAGFYCLPWWTIEQWELVKKWLVREFVEELWITPKVWKIINVHDFVDSKRWLILDVWYDILNVDDFENIDLEKTTHWFELEEIWFYDLEEIKWKYKPEFLAGIV